MKQTSKAIIFLDRQKITVAAIGLETPIEIDIPQSVVFDIEIIDPDGLESLISSSLEQNKIEPSEVIIVLSNLVYCEKSTNLTADPVAKKSQSEAFLQTIPYKNLFFKEYVLGNQIRMIALNKDFYEPVVRFFEKQRFNVVAVLPVFIFDYLHLILTQYNSKEVKAIYQKSNIALPYSLISEAEIDKSMEVLTYHPVENRARTKLLIVSFCALWIILLLLIFIRPILLKQSYTKQIQTTIAALPTSNPIIPKKQPEATPTVDYLSLQNTRVRIVNSSGVTNQASKIKEALSTAGFNQITVVTAAIIHGEKSQVEYTPEVSAEVLQELIAQLEPVTGVVETKQIEVVDNADIVVTTILK